MSQARFCIFVDDSPEMLTSKVSVEPGTFNNEPLTDLERTVIAEHVIIALGQIYQVREHKKHHERERDAELAERKRSEDGDSVPEISDFTTGGKVGIC